MSHRRSRFRGRREVLPGDLIIVPGAERRVDEAVEDVALRGACAGAGHQEVDVDGGIGD
jgi:hypothetical protein